MFGKHGIMLVEESAEIANQFLQAFREASIGNPVTSFSSTTEAIAHLEKNVESNDRIAHPLPCFILLSLLAKESSGFDFLKWLRGHPKLRRMPVVAFTHGNDPQSEGKAYDAGANSVFAKPSSSEDLLRVVKSINGYWVILVEKPLL